MKNFNIKIIYFLIFLLASGILSFRILGSNMAGIWQVWIPIVYFNIGGLVGYLLFSFDRIVDIYIGNPETKLAIVVKEYFSRSKYREGLIILRQNSQLQKRLIIRSVLFQGIWIGLMFFSITSISSTFGKGFIFGLGLRLLLEEWMDYFRNKDYLIEWLFWPVTIEIDKNLLKKYMIGMTIVTVMFFLMMIK